MVDFVYKSLRINWGSLYWLGQDEDAVWLAEISIELRSGEGEAWSGLTIESRLKTKMKIKSIKSGVRLDPQWDRRHRKGPNTKAVRRSAAFSRTRAAENEIGMMADKKIMTLANHRGRLRSNDNVVLGWR